jgi:Asp-tRNA(Asn)/Glu-tRNA(Gln) amidotransferase A subunit family amidase
LYKHSNGMPFGLQVLGKRNEDVKLLAFADYLLNKK